MKRQRDRVMDYIKEHGGITQLEALEYIQCMRLAPRIWELKNLDGAIIKTETVYRTNSNGERKHFAKYVLIKDEPICNCDTDKSTDVSKLV